jgi:anti-anti-sigma factor
VREPAANVEPNITGLGVLLAVGPWSAAEDTRACYDSRPNSRFGSGRLGPDYDKEGLISSTGEGVDLQQPSALLEIPILSYLAAFRVTIESVEDASLVRVGGDLDKSTAPELRRHLRAVRLSSGTTLLDLANVSFIDSVGVGVLLAENEATLAAGGAMFVLRPSQPVRRLIALMGCADQLAVIPASDYVSLAT